MFSWLAVAIGALVLFIVSGVTTYWQDILSLPASAAAFLGALAGAGGGLLAIILGALFNAELNRHRDDRLRAHQDADRARDEAVLAMGLRAELIDLQYNAINRIVAVDRVLPSTGPIYPANYSLMDIPPTPVYATTTHRVGDLGAAPSLAVITAHGYAAHIRTNSAAFRAIPPDAVLDDKNMTSLRRDFLSLLKHSLAAINTLDGYLGDPPHYPDPQLVLDKYAPTEPAEPDAEKPAE